MRESLTPSPQQHSDGPRGIDRFVDRLRPRTPAASVARPTRPESPTTSVTLAHQFGVGGEPERLRPYGATRYSRHALATLASPIRRCRASSRDDQCVTAYVRGGGVNVAVTIAA